MVIVFLMGDNSRSTYFEESLNIPDTRAIMGQLNNLFVGTRLVGVVQVIQLEGFVTNSTKISLYS